MSRVSSLVFGTVVASIVACVSGCQVQASIKTKTRFVEQNIVKEDTADWDGGPISIKIEGVGVSLNGGVSVVADPNATKVKATARFLALAFEDEKANADLSIVEAKNTFTLTNNGASGISVACGHGGSHGSSNAGESGCEKVDIVVPTGTDAQKLNIKVLSGSGTLTLQLSAAIASNIEANAAGADTNADLPATQGATISLVSESSDIAAKLPANFAADEIILQADADKLVLGPFTDIKNGAGLGGRGTAGTGLASLKLTAKSFAGSTGTITLQ